MSIKFKDLIENLEQDNLAIIVYEGTDGISRRKLFSKAKKNFYNVRTDEFSLISYLEDTTEIILGSSITQYLISEGTIYPPERLVAVKQFYASLTEKYKTLLGNITMLELSHLVKSSASPSESDVTKIKEYVLEALKDAVKKEKENITAEFQSYNQNEPPKESVEQTELNYVLEFLDGVAKDMSIFDGRHTIEEILNAWPSLLQPSPLADLYPILLRLSQP